MASGLRYILLLPVLLTQLVERAVLQLGGANWGRSGFCFITVFLGALGLRLWGTKNLASRCFGWFLCAFWMVLLGCLAVQLPWWRLAICVPWLVIFFFFLRQDKRLCRDPAEPVEPNWVGRSFRITLERLDYVSLGMVAVAFGALWLARNTFHPLPPDSYYHMSVARRIVEDGAIPLWDTWHFAPVGRPHLYPPLFHLLIAVVSLPFGGDVYEGFKALQAVLLPLTLLTTWYATRWLFNSKRAFFAMLIAGTDLALIISNFFCTPSALVNNLVLLLLITFLSKRFVLSFLLAALGLNAHMGVMPFALAGLFLFALWDRQYLVFWCMVAGSAALAALPWYLHVWAYSDWLGHPVEQGIFGEAGPLKRFFYKIIWLQMLNVIMVFLMVRAWGMTRRSEKRNALILSLLVAFIPMLFSYGGRYFVHTMQLWSMLIAVAFTGLVKQSPAFRHIGKFIIIAFLCPTLLMVGKNGPRDSPGPMVGIPGWFVIAGAASGGFLLLDRAQKNVLGVSMEEAQSFGAHLRTIVPKDQVLYIDDALDVALMIGFFADRSIDQGAWPEVSKPLDLSDQAHQNGAVKEEAKGLHITRNAHVVALRTDITWHRHGEFFLGTEGNSGQQVDTSTRNAL